MSQENTKLETILQRTAQKQSSRIANLTLDLDIAYTQIELLQQEMKDKEDTE